MPDFVSAGTDPSPPNDSQSANDKWVKAREEVELARRKKEEEGRQADGKSLYEVLQANKAAKQEAFEESIRLKNQFRSLDEDEVDFLDSVLESTRAKEAAVREETTEQLDQFRKQQEEAEKAALTQEGSKSPDFEPVQWTTGKRKRRKDHEAFKGLKLRRASSSAADKDPQTNLSPSKESVASEHPKISSEVDAKSTPQADTPKHVVESETKAKLTQSAMSASPKHLPDRAPSTVSALGLGDYSSDDD